MRTGESKGAVASLLDELRTLTAGIAQLNHEVVDHWRKQAQSDPLTGLPGQTVFQERLVLALAEADANGHCAGVFHIDLDRFKAFNETLGYAAGDQLMEQVARRLETCIGPSDTLARIASDEFAAVVAGAAAPAAVEQVAQALLGSLRAPFEVSGQEVFLRASIGFSVFPEDAREPKDLEKKADAALRGVKRLGRFAARRFLAGADDVSNERFELEIGLHRALERGQLYLCYQSQFDLRTGQLSGHEALLRWQHPELGLIPAGKFVPVAEESGLIVQIGAWVLEEACRQNQDWIARGFLPGRVAVNVSVVQFERPDFVDIVSGVLERTGLLPRLLELELTESMVMREPEASIPKIARLRELGVRLAMDDFGTGYSSLSHLQRLQLDLLKIDRCFVGDLKENKKAEPLVRAIITLAHGLGMRVIAEGVETEYQLGLLGRLGCDEAQGYLLGMPLPPKSFEDIAISDYRHSRDLGMLMNVLGSPDFVPALTA